MLSGEIQIKKPDGTIKTLKLQSKPRNEEKAHGDSSTPNSGTEHDRRHSSRSD